MANQPSQLDTPKLLQRRTLCHGSELVAVPVLSLLEPSLRLVSARRYFRSKTQSLCLGLTRLQLKASRMASACSNGQTRL